ncbi:GntR family transcriptional regulator [Maribrevibacterium harenarium]|uniref:GntR family transcriptional regulator n=1 Tax=Maribrevibacterium harenarium TaxID=2589817 RepID=A0A501X453_9GAMM|nr:GntR family transcriptional regulator [Maribrevibacterium harenarium]TPE55223.1 GntR family transcriptional regulator [Maribrevibacterium harenarium]
MADFLYKQVVDWFLAQLSQGDLAPGDKMPSLRKLAKTLDLSLNTIIHGYDILMEEKWIESRPKSGYFVCHKSTTRYAHVLAGDQVRNLVEDGGKLSWAALSHRAALVDQCDAFLPLAQKQDEVSLPVLGKGHLTAREAVADHLSKVGIKAHPSQIWLGRSPLAIFTQAVQSLTQPGDRALVLTPCDPRLTATLKSLQREVFCLASGERGVDLDEVVRCLRDDNIKLLVLPSQYGFPAGLEISNLSLRRWLALLKQVGIPAIEWDMTSHLGYKATNIMTYKALDESNQLVYIGGVESRGVDRSAAWCLAAQFTHLEGAILSADLALTEAQQQALTDALQPNATQSLSKRARQIWSAVEKAKSELEQQLGERIQIAPAKGGLALWVQIAAPLNRDDMTKLLAKHRHGILPGNLATNEEDAEHWLAVNATYPELSSLAAMLATLIPLPTSDNGDDGVAVDQEPRQQNSSAETIAQIELDTDVVLDDAEIVALPLEQGSEESISGEVATPELEEANSHQAPDESTESKATGTASSHHYNPMLDLINHDFG